MNGDEEIYQLSTSHNRHLQQYSSNMSQRTIQTLLNEIILLLFNDDVTLNQKSLSKSLRLIESNCVVLLANDSTKFDALACVHLNIAAVLYSLLDTETSLTILLPIVQRSLSDGLQDQPLIEIYSCKLFFQIMLSLGAQFNRLQSGLYQRQFLKIADSLQKKFAFGAPNLVSAKISKSFIHSMTIHIKGNFGLNNCQVLLSITRCHS